MIPPVVNFINILHANFGPIFLRQKFLNPKHSFVIFGAKILYKKRARKTLMKLTPVHNRSKNTSLFSVTTKAGLMSPAPRTLMVLASSMAEAVTRSLSVVFVTSELSYLLESSSFFWVGPKMVKMTGKNIKPWKSPKTTVKRKTWKKI